MLCELVRRDFDGPIFHRMTDLSAYGVWLETSFPMPVGARVALAFMPPGCDEIIVFAEVTRTRDRRDAVDNRGMGLEFIDLTDEERLQLVLALRRVPSDGVAVKRFDRLVH